MTKDKPRIRVCPPTAGVRGEICVDGVCFQWPEPECGFKPQTQGWLNPNFDEGVVVCGGNWGRQLIYEKDTQNTYFEGSPPSFWLYPDIDDYNFGGMEEVVEGLEDRRVYSVAKKYNQMIGAGIVEGEGVEIPPATVSLNDLFMEPLEDAFTRAAYLTNLPRQPEGVKVVKLYQANSTNSFNQYLGQLKDEGWRGVWVRPNRSVWGDLEYFVDAEL